MIGAAAKRVAQRGEIARPAAAERQARQRALDVGRAAQRLRAASSRGASSSTKNATMSSRASIARGIGRAGPRAARASRRAPAPVTRAVDGGEQASRALAVERAARVRGCAASPASISMTRAGADARAAA